MRKIFYSLAILFTTVIFVFFPTQESWACTPQKYPDSILNQLINSDIAFIGTVTKIESSTISLEVTEFPITLATFDIHSKWKGNLDDSIKIQTQRGVGSCGMNFWNNTSYLILVHSNENGYPWIDYFTPKVKLTDNVGLNFIKIFLRFIVDLYVLVPLLIIIPSSIAVVVIKKRKRRDSK